MRRAYVDREEAAQRARDERAEQGLPPTIEDDQALGHLARLFLADADTQKRRGSAAA